MISVALAIITLGVQAVLVQVLLIRETLVVYFGNELTIGIVLFSWLIGVAGGAFVTIYLTDRLRRPLVAFILIQSVMAIVPFGQLWLIRSVRLVLATPAGELIPFSKVFISALAFVMPFGFLVGMAFPIACAVWRAYLPNGISGALSTGIVYSMEGFGALLAGLLYTFVLIDRMSAWTIIAGLAVVVWSIAAVVSFNIVGTRSRTIAVCTTSGLALAGLLAFAVGVPSRFDEMSSLARWRSFGQPGRLVKSRDTRYQNLALAEREGQFSLFANGRYVWSFPERYETPAATHLVMCQHPRPRRVLLLGASPDSLVEILRYPIESVDYVHLDPSTLRLIEPYLDASARAAIGDGRVRVHYTDGRRFVKTTNRTFDLVIARLPDPSTAFLNRFYTREFYKEVKARLAPDGVFVTSIRAAVGYMGTELISYSGSVYATLRSVFPEVVVAPGTEQYMCAGCRPGTVTVDPKVLAGRFRASGVKSPFFSWRLFKSMLPKERVTFIKRKYGEAKHLQVNTDTNPVTYFRNLVLWDRFAGGRLAPWMSKMRESGRTAGITGIIAVIGAVGGASIVGRRRDKKTGPQRRAALIAIFATGAAGMAIDILGMYAFQNTFGYVYREAGLIVGLFMAGLTVGGVFGTYKAARAERPITWFIATESMLIVYMLLFSPLTAWTSVHTDLGKTVLMSAIFLGSFFAGLQFPLANRFYVMAGGTAGRAASFTESADHGGACLGALLAGVVLVPLFGLAGACMAVALLKLWSLGLLATSRFG